MTPGPFARQDEALAASAGGTFRLQGVRRRRRVPFLLTGVVLVVGATLGGIVAANELGQREPVLVLADEVTVGQQLRAEDVREVRMAIESGPNILTADSLDEVIGQRIAYTLPEGALLTKEVLGRSQVPAAGEAVAAVALEPGQFPPGVQPGTAVRVIAAGADEAASDTDTPTGTWPAVISAVHNPDEGQVTVVSLQMGDADAQALAAIPDGELSVVTVAGGAP
ncbi:SAF domain-containing protein [Streptomyces sp. B8F3]|uniref:SAF domain-containing protein n=1 Tax=Streptomyces sp. B8F3 TaxID=3153573 RepID=UPI00325DE93F